jgi:N-acetylmuramoyl-L-alanine amidase
MFKTMIRKCVYILVLFVFLFSLQSFTVVIDAGHGGQDVGAVGLKMGIQEKDLNLAVAKQLAEKIRANYPDVNVILTRDKDVFLTLQNRADIVNKCKDSKKLFISIHTNAADNRNACGAETFILGTERMEDNLDVAMRENSVMKLEKDLTVYQGFDNSIESYIMFELMQHDYMDSSLAFAEKIQNEFVNTLKRANRGVRQAAFWVLLKSACPGVLVEMGFISNAEEEKWLASDAGQKGIVNGIYTAFVTYYKENKNK